MDRTKYKRIKGYLDGDPSALPESEVKEWLRKQPADADVEEALQAFWSDIPESVGAQESRAGFARFWKQTDVLSSPRLPLIPRLLRVARNAAAILFIPLVVGSVLLLRNAPPEPQYLELAVAPGQRDSLRLSDNTMVWLNAGSRLIYPETFGNGSRQVFLSGEAYFDVEEDSGRPFIVGAGNVHVRVLGTQFNVSSYENMQSVSVSLVEGSVSMEVEYDGISRNALLVPGDVMRFDRQSGELEKSRMQADAYCTWLEGGFYFNNQPLAEIVAQFERVFGVKIYIADPQLRTTRYTLAFVNRESLGGMLEAIAQVNNLNVNRNNDMIVLSSNP